MSITAAERQNVVDDDDLLMMGGCLRMRSVELEMDYARWSASSEPPAALSPGPSACIAPTSHLRTYTFTSGRFLSIHRRKGPSLLGPSSVFPSGSNLNACVEIPADEVDRVRRP